MIFQKIPHQLYYLLELTALFLGFFLVFLFSPNLILQFIIMFVMLSLYAIIGALHHRIHHTLRRRVMVEYILISLLIFAIFLFLNIDKF